MNRKILLFLYKRVFLFENFDLLKWIKIDGNVSSYMFYRNLFFCFGLIFIYELIS